MGGSDLQLNPKYPWLRFLKPNKIFEEAMKHVVTEQIKTSSVISVMIFIEASKGIIHFRSKVDLFVSLIHHNDMKASNCVLSFAKTVSRVDFFSSRLYFSTSSGAMCKTWPLVYFESSVSNSAECGEMG